MTLTDIAEELGLSISTVSNAYNRPDQLSAATRKQVLATAKRLGYAGPDPRAQLAAQRAGRGDRPDRAVAARCPHRPGIAAHAERRRPGVRRSRRGARAHPQQRGARVPDGHRAHRRRRRLRRPLRRARRRAPADRRGAAPARSSCSTGEPAPDDPSVGIDEEGGGERRRRPPARARSSAAGRSSPSRPHGDSGSTPCTTDRLRRLPSRRRGRRHRPGHRAPVVEGSAYDRAETAAVARRILLAGPTARPAVLAMSDEMAVAVIDAADRRSGCACPRTSRSSASTTPPPLATARRRSPRCTSRMPRRAPPRCACCSSRTATAGDHVPRRARRAGLDRPRRRRRVDATTSRGLRPRR